MLQDIHIPHQLTGRELDLYLAHGWYRMGPAIFTTHAITLQGWIYPVQWLRIRLEQMEVRPGLQKLMRQNRHLSVSVRPLEITDELDQLYARYYDGISFEASPTIADFLLCGASNAAYDSYVVQLRTETGQLAAAGIYDQGENSIAGIMNFYDPAFQKSSPGKYLMLLKALIAREAGMLYYYPGYIATGMSKFDYKKQLAPEATEYYDPAGMCWHPLSELPPSEILPIPSPH
jgi:arginine-tRNA-protein transferase